MPLTSIGYDGTVDELGFAQMMMLAGNRYSVTDRAAFAATQVTGARAITLAPGLAYGPGVRTTNDAALRVDFPSPSSGAWHLVALRRDWETNTQTIVTLTDSTYNTINAEQAEAPTTWPTAMKRSPGSVDDQPLYWAWVNSSTVAVALVDLRRLPTAVPRVGTDAERSAYYYQPVTVAQMNALDGSTWENTQWHRHERYFGPRNTLYPGWYPVGGLMPINKAAKTTGHSVDTAGAVIGFNRRQINEGGDFINHPIADGGQTWEIRRHGVYRITYRCAIGANTTMIMRALVNGAAHPSLNQDLVGGQFAWPKMTLNELVLLNAGDVVKFDVRATANCQLDLPMVFACIEFVQPISLTPPN
jgi:hypothetical protein